MHKQSSSTASTSSTSSSKFDAGETIAQLVDAMSARLNSSAFDASDLLAILDRLRTKLRCRFPDKDDELVEEAVFQAPWLTGFAEALRHEHVEVLQSLDTLREKVTRFGDKTATAEEVTASYQTFSERLTRHNEDWRNLLHQSQLCQGHLEDD